MSNESLLASLELAVPALGSKEMVLNAEETLKRWDFNHTNNKFPEGKSLVQQLWEMFQTVLLTVVPPPSTAAHL